MNNLHPFTVKGLGIAPFICVRVEKRAYSPARGVVLPGGSCDLCGESLIWCYVIRDGNRKEFTVGCECVKKCDPLLARSLASVRREQNRKEAFARLGNPEIMKQFSAVGKPADFSFFWPSGRVHDWTMGDWITWALKFGYAKERDKAIAMLLEAA